jgi:hypothetical protein
MNDNEQMVQFGVAKSQKSKLSMRMIRISKSYCKRIGEDGCRVMKRDTMLFSVDF